MGFGMICWVLGWQKREFTWAPVVYGALPDVLPGESCKPALVSPHKEEVSCKRCREAFTARGAKAIDKYLAEKGL
jgi:hypothetical protein